MVTNLEKFVGKLSPLGFTPLLSTASGQVLKYDFKGVGPRIFDKSGHGNGGILKPKWPKNAPRREIIHAVPPDVRLVFDGEDDYVRGPRGLTVGSEITVDAVFTARELKRFEFILSQGIPEKEGRGFYARLNENGGLQWLVGIEGDDYMTSRPGETVVNAGDRYRLTANASREKMQVFLNGAKTDERPIGTPLSLQSTEPLIVGANPRPYNFLSGGIERVSIYNEVRTPR